MARRTYFTMICLAIASSACLSADNDAPQLPKDGWWIRYHAKIKQDGPNGQIDYTATSTWSLVGTETVDDERCRWLEIDSVTTFTDKKHSVLSKYLIPEKDLRHAETLTKNIKRGWISVNGGEAHRVNEDRNQMSQELTFYFDGGWNDSEKIDELMVVEYQHGSLEIQYGRKVVDTTTKTQENGQSIEKMVSTSTGWFDPKTSPLISAMNRTHKRYKGDKLYGSRFDEIRAQDSGTDAKTKLPERN